MGCRERPCSCSSWRSSLAIRAHIRRLLLLRERLLLSKLLLLFLLLLLGIWRLLLLLEVCRLLLRVPYLLLLLWVRWLLPVLLLWGIGFLRVIWLLRVSRMGCLSHRGPGGPRSGGAIRGL